MGVIFRRRRRRDFFNPLSTIYIGIYLSRSFSPKIWGTRSFLLFLGPGFEKECSRKSKTLSSRDAEPVQNLIICNFWIFENFEKILIFMGKTINFDNPFRFCLKPVGARGGYFYLPAMAPSKQLKKAPAPALYPCSGPGPT